MTDIDDNCRGCVDLHTHSTASDGSDSPRELMDKAARLGLSVIALTDHDTISGIPEALSETEVLKAKGYALRCIPGCEFCVSYDGKDIHMIGLHLNPDTPGLLSLLKEAEASRKKRNELMLSRFQADGFAITMKDLTGSCPDTEITRAHFARVLTEKGYAADFSDAFARYLGHSSRYYVQREFLEPDRVIDTIHEAGGISVLAHPLQYRFPPDKLRRMIEEFCGYGLDAMETKYSAYCREEEFYLRSLALRYGLKRSGGSDYHGPIKPGLSLGTGYGNGWCILPEDVTVL